MNELPRCFAVISKNKKILSQSSSGGAFYYLASKILTSGGFVYGVTIEHGNVFHKRVSSIDDLYSVMSTKYVASDLKHTFNECLHDLENNQKVLFAGTPCQIYALKKYLELKNVSLDNLVTCDTICHGVPLKKYWDMYIKEKFGSINCINSTNFRKKRHSWENYFVEINGICQRHNRNAYMRAFLHDYILMESCYSCKFKGEHRFSDITLGDFWGIKQSYPSLYDKHGVSLVVIRNDKFGLLDALKFKCKVREVSYSISLKPNISYYSSAVRPSNKNDFDDSLNKNGFAKTIQLFIGGNTNNGKRVMRSFLSSIIRLFPRPIRINKYKKKIGIITDFGYSNFGNRLQNYALRTILNRMGFSAYNLKYDELADRWCFPLLNYIRFLKCFVKSKKYKHIYKASIKSGEKNSYFNNSVSSIKQLNSFEYLIYGSDQIWNWSYHTTDLLFTLGIVDGLDNNKKIAYGASFGVSYLPEEIKRFYLEGFSSFKSIGVRECAGVTILNKLKVPCQLTLDPTLLLKRFDWDVALTKYSKIDLPSDFTLIYILGDENKQIIDNISTSSVIDLRDKSSKYNSVNHFDFVKLIKESSLIITDSFHAIVFSIIYGKKVYIIKREGMDSRIISLFSEICVDLEYEKIIDLKETYAKVNNNPSISFIKRNLAEESQK